jgi:hypothetical protein
MRSFNKIKTLLCIEGIFYLLGGLWPLVALQSFLRVTGGKTDTWLVVMVGVLLAVYGLSLVVESRSAAVSNGVKVLAIGVPLALLWVDVYYVYSGMISSVYMIDALIENMIVLSWLLIFVTR